MVLGVVGSAVAAFDPSLPDTTTHPSRPGMDLVFHDEFAIDGNADPAVWSFEKGFVRNQELQWYQPDNATCKGGVLLIEGRKESVPNPNYVAGSSDWKTNRQNAQYTSSSLTTSGRRTFQFGRLEVRARIDAQMGSWPAIWTVGARGEWPTGGEIDLMEFYPSGSTPTLHANVAWGTATRWTAKWNSKTKPLSAFTAKDPDWVRKFHVWAMDWDKDTIKLWLDSTLLNTTATSQTVNADGTNPFKDRAQYVILNLAMGGNGGDPSKATFPMKYEVDYVRIYQPKTTEIDRHLSGKARLRVVGGRLSVDGPLSGDERIEVRSADGRVLFSGFPSEEALRNLSAGRGVRFARMSGAEVSFVEFGLSPGF